MYIPKKKIKACLKWILYSLTPNNLLFVFSQTITFTKYNWKLNKNSNTWYKSDFGCLHFLNKKKKWKTVWKTKKKLWFMIFIPIFSDFVSEFSLVDFSDAAMFIPISTIKIIKEKKNWKKLMEWALRWWYIEMMIFIVFIENLFFCCRALWVLFTFLL